jgi:hypothetical protein
MRMSVRRVLLYMLEAVEGELCLLEVLEVLDMLEVIRCVLLRMLEAVDGGLCLLEVLEVLEALEVPEVMCCVPLCMLETVYGRGLMYAEGWRLCSMRMSVRRVLFCMLEAVEGELCLLEVLEVLEVLDMLEVIRYP